MSRTLLIGLLTVAVILIVHDRIAGNLQQALLDFGPHLVLAAFERILGLASQNHELTVFLQRLRLYGDGANQALTAGAVHSPTH